MKNDLERDVKRMANAIVELVEQTDGPVTLTRLDRDIPGFSKKDDPSWSYEVDAPLGEVVTEVVIWNGMTEAGSMALQSVLRGRRVAIQFVSVILYLLEGHIINDENWLPAVLLPARAANWDTPMWLVRGSEKLRKSFAEGAEKRGTHQQPLNPGSVGSTADAFSV